MHEAGRGFPIHGNTAKAVVGVGCRIAVAVSGLFQGAVGVAGVGGEGLEPKSCDLSWFGRIDIVFLEIMATVQLYHFCFKRLSELFP